MFSKQQVQCWRFALTDDGREAISELFGETETM